MGISAEKVTAHNIVGVGVLPGRQGPRASRAATAQTGSRARLGHKDPRVSEVLTEFVEPRACRAETG